MSDTSLLVHPKGLSGEQGSCAGEAGTRMPRNSRADGPCHLPRPQWVGWLALLPNLAHNLAHQSLLWAPRQSHSCSYLKLGLGKKKLPVMSPALRDFWEGFSSEITSFSCPNLHNCLCFTASLWLSSRKEFSQDLGRYYSGHVQETELTDGQETLHLWNR